MFVFPLNFSMILSSLIFFPHELSGMHKSWYSGQPILSDLDKKDGLMCISHGYYFSGLLCNAVYRTDSVSSSTLSNLKSKGDQSCSLQGVIQKVIPTTSRHGPQNPSPSTLESSIKMIPGDQVSQNGPHPYQLLICFFLYIVLFFLMWRCLLKDIRDSATDKFESTYIRSARQISPGSQFSEIQVLLLNNRIAHPFTEYQTKGPLRSLTLTKV